MRSDRRRELEEQRRQLRAERRAKKGNGFCRTLSIIYTLILIAFIAALMWLNVLPAKYLYPLIGFLVLMSLFIVPVMYSRHGVKKRKIIATFFSIILMAGFGVGTYYMIDTLDFLGEITVGEKVQKEDYYVVVGSQASYTDIQGINGKTVGTQLTTDNNYSKAKIILQDTVPVEFQYIDGIDAIFEKLRAGECEAIFISSASYEIMKSQTENLETETKILYTVSIELPKAGGAMQVNVTKEPFNIYISGIDIEGDISTQSRSDVNMVVTVNPVTHKALLTSIPRDYYVNLPTKNAMDKLTHSGLYGIQETMGAVENMLEVKMNYYVRVNYTTVVKLVDAMGGIDIDSPYSFTTHGMQELNGITFVKGANHLDGRMALAYSRERKSWADGDMRRNENQQLILEAIIKKATGSTTLLSKYTSILDAVRGNMETNMTQEEMTSLIKMQLADMPSWDISKDALKGTPDYLQCYALGFPASVVDQDPEMIVKATDLIIKTMNEQAGEENNGD